MRYNQLGRTGLFVSELSLGTMTFGGGGSFWGAIGKLGQAEADGLLRQAIEAGINFVDTADVYSEGVALGLAERHGLARPVSLQAYYTIAGRDLEREIVPMLSSEGVGLMVWSPLAGGLLSGKYTRGVAAQAPRPPVDYQASS